MDIGVVSVISTAVVGALGVMVPIGVKLLDRKHQHRAWLLDKRSEIYQRVVQLVNAEISESLPTPPKSDRSEVYAGLITWGSLAVGQHFANYMDAKEFPEREEIGRMMVKLIRQELQD